MSTLPAAIRTALLAIDALRSLLSTDGENRVAENHPRQEWLDALFCVYVLRATDNEDCLGDAVGTQPFRQYWDLEFWAPSVGQAELARQLMHGGLHLYRGAFGAATVQGIFVTDHSGDYTPRSDYSDQGLHLAAAEIQICGYTGA
jgi:hypothetical protein